MELEFLEEKVEECSIKQLKPESRKEVKIIKLSIKIAQVTELEFFEERVEILELGKPQGNVAVVSKFKETYENVKVNKNIQVLSHEERESCNKEIKVERNIIVEDIGNRKEIYINPGTVPLILAARQPYRCFRFTTGGRDTGQAFPNAN